MIWYQVWGQEEGDTSIILLASVPGDRQSAEDIADVVKRNGGVNVSIRVFNDEIVQTLEGESEMNQLDHFKAAFAPDGKVHGTSATAEAIDWSKLFQLFQMILPLIIQLIPKTPVVVGKNDEDEFKRPDGEK